MDQSENRFYRERGDAPANGGPAFPHDDRAQAYERAGMTLRDYFAAQAMTALIPIEEKDEGQGLREFAKEIAEGAYEYADAMLRARGAA